MLQDNLVDAWSLNNTLTGIKGNTLTNNNGVTFPAGLVYPKAANFVRASSQSLSLADNPAISFGVGVDMTVIAWVKAATLPASFLSIAGQDDYGTGSRAWNMSFNGTGGLVLQTFSGAGALASPTATTFGAISAGVWYMVAVNFDHVAGKCGISVNGGVFDQASQTDLRDSTAPFRIGSLTNNGVGSAEFWDGIIGPVYFWKRVLSAGEITTLYNGGAGFRFPTGHRNSGQLLNGLSIHG